jgi:hypothetical protein
MPRKWAMISLCVKILSSDLPQKILKYHRAHNPHCKETYNSNIWFLALVEYLGEYWGEYWGDDFGKSEDKILTHNEIIAHLRGMS